jgi:release factor glutamine methyltransferase
LVSKLSGVSCPDDGVAILLDCLLERALPLGAAVLDLGSEPGLMADLLERAGVAVTRSMDLRTRRGRAQLRGRRWAARRESFDVIVADAPFLAGPEAPTLICRDAPYLLADHGVLWLVQSALLDPQDSMDRLGAAGLNSQVVERREVAFRPAMWSRAAALRAEGLIGPDQCTEELVVIRASMAVIVPEEDPVEPVPVREEASV